MGKLNPPCELLIKSLYSLVCERDYTKLPQKTTLVSVEKTTAKWVTANASFLDLLAPVPQFNPADIGSVSDYPCITRMLWLLFNVDDSRRIIYLPYHDYI